MLIEDGASSPPRSLSISDNLNSGFFYPYLSLFMKLWGVITSSLFSSIILEALTWNVYFKDVICLFYLTPTDEKRILFL